MLELIKPGNKIEIQPAAQAIKGAAEKKIYTSKIYDIQDDERLEILMPMEGTKLILLPVDGEFHFCFYTDRGLYQCFVRIIDRYKSNQIYLLLCELTSPLSKYQRREYYRYSCSMPIRTRDLMPEELQSLEEGRLRLCVGLPMTKGQIADISGGGVRFVTSAHYEAGTKILLSFALNIQGKEIPYELTGVVIANREIETQRGMLEHRIMFVGINGGSREEIIRYIFEEERRNRRR